MAIVSNCYTSLAKDAVSYYLRHQKAMPCPPDLEEPLKPKAAAFVSIKKDGRLRGCIGTLEPQQDNLAREIIENAIKAATKDPRFEPVSVNELTGLSFSVDVLTPLERVDNFAMLDPKRYGLVVKNGDKQGVLLPDLDGVRTVEDQVRLCRAKGGIEEDDPQEYYRFRVQRHR